MSHGRFIMLASLIYRDHTTMTIASSFSGPLTLDRKAYYSPTKSYIKDTKPQKEKVDPKQKAASLFYEFYVNNKEALPSKVVLLKHRYEIERLILKKTSVEEAFKQVLHQDS